MINVGRLNRGGRQWGYDIPGWAQSSIFSTYLREVVDNGAIYPGSTAGTLTVYPFFLPMKIVKWPKWGVRCHATNVDKYVRAGIYSNAGRGELFPKKLLWEAPANLNLVSLGIIFETLVSPLILPGNRLYWIALASNAGSPTATIRGPGAGMCYHSMPTWMGFAAATNNYNAMGLNMALTWGNAMPADFPTSGYANTNTIGFVYFSRT